ncbi:MAG: Hsp20/alpha crystallin family protein [Syntrophobacteraceae bacterium]|jgi:HSP20 family protein|nr:Hsp20/alpha crystallin family protein [Syntrophobacteraceae bacterium]
MQPRSDPIIEELKAMKQRMDVLFHETLAEAVAQPEPSPAEQQMWNPLMDCWEGSDLWVLHADLPGVGPDQVSLEVTDGMLRISGIRKLPAHPAHSNVHAAERPGGAFERAVLMPRDARYDSIEAELRGGVLTIRIQKQPGAPVVSRRIPVLSE